MIIYYTKKTNVHTNIGREVVPRVAGGIAAEPCRTAAKTGDAWEAARKTLYLDMIIVILITVR